MASLGDVESDGSAPCCGMRGCPSPWPWPSFRTTPHEDRGWLWGHEQNYTAKVRKPLTPQRGLFSLEEEPGGGLPAPLSEVAGRQGTEERHIVEDLGELAPLVQILDLPMPQLVDHVVDALRIDQFAELLNLEEDVLDAGRLVNRYFQVPEQVIEVPKISCSPCPSRCSIPEPQVAEQLGGCADPQYSALSKTCRSTERARHQDPRTANVESPRLLHNKRCAYLSL